MCNILGQKTDHIYFINVYNTKISVEFTHESALLYRHLIDLDLTG